MSDAEFRRREEQLRRIAEIIQAQRQTQPPAQPLTEEQRRAAQQQAIAQLLGPAPAAPPPTIGPNLAARERQRLLNAASQRAAPSQQQPLTEAQRRAAQQQAITQLLGPGPAAQRPTTAPQQPITDAQRRAEAQRLTNAQSRGPRPQARPQGPAQNTGMNSQSREFFERQRLLNAQVQRQTQAAAPPRYDPAADDRLARKLNAIVTRSDIEVSQNGYAIEIRQRGAARDAVIRAITSPRTVSSSTPRYR